MNFFYCCLDKKKSISRDDPLDKSMHNTKIEIINNDIDHVSVSDIEINNIIEWNDTIEFRVPIKGGQVIKVYDGDTITVASKLPYNKSPLYRFSVRLNGIDTPEIKGKNVNHEEKEVAKNARDFLAKLILHKNVELKNIKTEKYGRVLADVYFKDICINELMIKEKYAVKYDGEKKIKPDSWLKYRIGDEKNIP